MFKFSALPKRWIGDQMLHLNLAVPDEAAVKAVLWFKQILKVFVCCLAGRHGPILKVLKRCRLLSKNLLRTQVELFALPAGPILPTCW